MALEFAVRARIARAAVVLDLSVSAPVAHGAVRLALAVRARVADGAQALQPAVRARVARAAVALDFAVRAPFGGPPRALLGQAHQRLHGLARLALVLHLAVGAPHAPRAVAPELAMRTGGARRAVLPQLAMRAAAALHTLALLPAVRTRRAVGASVPQLVVRTLLAAIHGGHGGRVPSTPHLRARGSERWISSEPEISRQRRFDDSVSAQMSPRKRAPGRAPCTATVALPTSSASLTA